MFRLVKGVHDYEQCFIRCQLFRYRQEINGARLAINGAKLEFPQQGIDAEAARNDRRVGGVMAPIPVSARA